MSSVRVLIGTKKGAFVAAADGTRKKWSIDGPLFGGWEIYHMKGSAVDPNRIYASQASSWFGQIIQRSDDGGKTWSTPGTSEKDLVGEDGMPKAGKSNMFVYDTSEETGQPMTMRQDFDGSPRPWRFQRVWHLEPSLENPDHVYAGVEDAAIFHSSDAGQTWHELAGLRNTESSRWAPGAGGLCLHTILLDPSDPKRIYTAISAAGVFRTDDGGTSWKPINRGLSSNFLPDPDAEVGHCVHRIAMHPAQPKTLYMQKHWDIMRSDDAGENWHEVSGNLPSDFGFPIDVHAHEPETIYVVPITSDSLHYPPDGKLRVYRNRTGGRDPQAWEGLANGLPQEHCYVNVLRDAMAVDTLDDCGIYFGTTGGQVYCSPDGGDSWTAIAANLPGVLSVEVQTLK